ncbi:MAG: hypothetical protein AYK19_10920 [Theionarchaea archaeon DG-70-1]|nr:MAG: hypothetical protein AYK19_10920 [Theionarchaea archaeon DG-70-1]
MKKAVTLVLFLLISFAFSHIQASHIEVTTFIFDPEQPQPDESVTVLIRLANKSYDKDVEVTCRLFIDGDLHDVKVVPVSHRSSSAVSFMWLAQPGAHVFSLETSYYTDHTEHTDTFFQYLTVPGQEEEIDYFHEALQKYDSKSYVQAKIMFEQAKRVFEEDNDMEQALVCEEYILRCDQYIEASQLFQQAEEAYAQENVGSALALYYQAQSLYQLLEDDQAFVCDERIQEIQEAQREQVERPYYLLLLLPVVAAVIAFVWLRTRKPPPPLPAYVPEKKVEKKRLFNLENTEKPEIVKELHEIESQLDTKDPQTFKSLVRDFKAHEAHFDKTEYTQEEAEYVEESLGVLKEKLKEKGKRLQDIQKLEDLHKRCDTFLNQPVGDLVDAYNRYAQLHNAFDQIPDLGIPEQQEVKAKLTEYYQFIQQQAKSGQSEMR